MGMQLLEGTTNPSTYYSGPDPNNFKWLIESITSTQVSAYVDFQGQKVYLTMRGSFDTSKIATIPKTLDELSAFSTGQERYTSFGLSIGTKAAFTVNWDTPVTSAVFSRYTEAASNADYAASLAGNDVYTAVSGNEQQATFLWDGNDTYIHRHLLQQYSDKVYGGDGTDKVVFDKVSTDFTIKAANVWNALTKKNDLTGFTVTDKNKVVNSMEVNEVERLQFTDTMLALDTGANQTAGSGYMLYKAAFNRTPDAGGLGYWINQMDKGMSYSDVAKNFVTSAEFKTAFGGANPSVNTLVTKLYNNVLNRTPDAGGLAFWQNKLSNEGWSTADVLGYFSTSGENVTNVTPLIANGIQYQQFVS
jgi:hypothetical protein